MESVIITTPILLIGYGAALILGVIEIFKHVTGYILLALSATFFIASTVYAVLLGAKYEEIMIVILLFLFVNIITFGIHKGGRK